MNEIRHVKWIDSSCASGWHPKEESIGTTPANCVTIGFLLEETDDYVSLYMSDDGQGNIDNCLTIPKFAVTEMVTIGESATESDE